MENAIEPAPACMRVLTTSSGHVATAATTPATAPAAKWFGTQAGWRDETATVVGIAFGVAIVPCDWVATEYVVVAAAVADVWAGGAGVADAMLPSVSGSRERELRSACRMALRASWWWESFVEAPTVQ